MMLHSRKFPNLRPETLANHICVRYRDQGWTLREIAEHYGMGKSTVHKVVKGSKVDRRSSGKRMLKLGDDDLRECSRCGVEQKLKHFMRSPSDPGGRGYICKACDQLRHYDVPLDSEL